MNALIINEQIAFLRRQKGITQEELAQILGVTNQSVSKWESGLCCPDIQLLPVLAAYFRVTVDQLLGYKSTESFDDIYLKIKMLFQSAEESSCFDLAYKLAFLLAEGVFTKGYKEYVPWNTDKARNKDEDFYKWGYSACSEPEGCSCVKRNSVFISSGMRSEPISAGEIRDIYSAIQPFFDKSTLKVLFALYELTSKDFSLYVSINTIAAKCKLPDTAVEDALDKIPVQLSPNGLGYRIEGCFMHIPPLLLMLTQK